MVKEESETKNDARFGRNSLLFSSEQKTEILGQIAERLGLSKEELDVLFRVLERANFAIVDFHLDRTDVHFSATAGFGVKVEVLCGFSVPLKLNDRTRPQEKFKAPEETQ